MVPCYFLLGPVDGWTLALRPDAYLYVNRRGWCSRYRLDRLEGGRAIYVYEGTVY